MCQHLAEKCVAVAWLGYDYIVFGFISQLDGLARSLAAAFLNAPNLTTAS